MADNSTIQQTQGVGAATQTTPAAQKKKEIGKDEFMQLLVAQLKYQDPMEPMKNEEFAVNLAQFSQLEQLVSMNEKLDKLGSSTSGGDLSSLATYLGHEVTIDSHNIEVVDHDAGAIRFELGQDAQAVALQLVEADGSVAESVPLGEYKAGKHTVSVSGLQSGSGTYEAKLVAEGTNGSIFNPEAWAAGIVSGFIPGADPSLLIGSREIKPGEIKEVNLAASL